MFLAILLQNFKEISVKEQIFVQEQREAEGYIEKSFLAILIEFIKEKCSDLLTKATQRFFPKAAEAAAIEEAFKNTPSTSLRMTEE